MGQTKISLRSIMELDNLKFSIPNYQRGYRWDDQLVKDLLKDIWEHFNLNLSGIYCLQPLVVKQCFNDEGLLIKEFNNAKSLFKIRNLMDKFDDEDICTWEVIDGQQRLTTICILQQYLRDKLKIDCKIYSIKYDTLKDTIKDCINNIKDLNETDANSNINLHFMYNAYQTINKWFEGWTDLKLQNFYKELREKVKFIWYQTEEDNPIQVFTRLNIGRISLTSSELVKAIFLNRENYEGSEVLSKQKAIALQWDSIENKLQDEEFWLFILSKEEKDKWKKPTRIDFILEFICQNDKEFDYPDEEVGTDQYRTFRCFYKKYEEFRSSENNATSKKYLDYWFEKVKKTYDTFNEWYNDGVFYHYIGYILALTPTKLLPSKRQALYEMWKTNDRPGFLKVIKEIISELINPWINLEYEYNDITQARPLLLLHNLILVLQTNKVMKSNNKYVGNGIFYKFPFHLFKIEKWNVEHIDSNTPNDLSSKADRDNWILSTYMSLTEKDKKSDEVKKLLLYYFEPQDNVNSNAWISFSDAKNILLQLLKKEDINNREWTNKIYNFTLLDENTNKSYHNAIFSSKRLHIVGKELGLLKVATWDRQSHGITENEVTVNSAFVPACTMKVFQKTWSTFQGDITSWTEDDALSYRSEIEKSITWFQSNDN